MVRAFTVSFLDKRVPLTGDRNSLRVSLQSLGPLPGRVEYDAPAIVSVET